ncbi:MAG: hypothetical protein QOG63_1468 [Thermoleophilaceae bacterium]|nr:hypothetical protein [Thermoleophilaceae bacterium]
MTAVLVLDDTTSDRALMASVLADQGYEVLEASTGEETLRLARAERPALIIAAVPMPAVDGAALVRELRADRLTTDIPVMFSTAADRADEALRLADEFGVSHILDKPYDREEIARAVAAELSGGQERDDLRSVNAKLVETVEELKAALSEQEQSLTLLETLQACAPIGIGFVDREFRIRRLNERLAIVNGLPLEDQLGRTVQEVAPQLWAQLEPLYRSVLESGEPVVNRRTVGEMPSDPGRTCTWLTSFYPVSLGSEVLGIGLVVVDITEREEAETLFSVVMDNMAEGLFVMDTANRFKFINSAASRMLGWGERELSGRSVHATLHARRADGSPCDGNCALVTTSLRATKAVVPEDVFTRADGTLLPVAYSVAPLSDGSSDGGSVVVLRDATDEQAGRTRVKRELDALSWVGRIRDALDEERLVLYSQPIVPLAGGAPSQEILLRMLDRDGEVIAPGRFLPAAEKYGVIAEIDHWVVTRALRLAADGQRVEANLSAASIGSPDLLSLVERQLRATGADPSNIVFEITETALMLDVKAGEAFTHYLVDLGCQIALDDFGTGFGSFTYLKTLPVDYLKIDIEFVRNLGSTPSNQHLVKAVVSLARGFGKQTIAGGVEDEETLTLLRDYGVDYAQGYHLGRPAQIEVPSLGT